MLRPSATRSPSTRTAALRARRRSSSGWPVLDFTRPVAMKTVRQRVSGLLPHEPRRAAVGVAAGAVALGVAWYAARRRSAVAGSGDGWHMGDDGRLSAAELDTVLGSAAAPTGPGRRPEPDPAAPSGKADVLDRGPDRPTWAESAQRWARGHRLTAAVVVLLAGAGTLGGWAYLASRPPPLLTTIDAAVLIDTIDPLPVRGSGAAILVRTNLVLHAADPGDDLRAVALHGPGLDQPQVRQSGTQVAASNMLDCNAIADLTVPATFALTVERSDPWGRVVTRDIAVTGIGADDAGTQIVRACLTRAADALQLRDVSYDGAAAGPLRLEIRNPTAVDLFTFGVAAALGAGGAFLHPPAAAPVSLPAGAVSTVSLAHDISDCFARASSYAHDWRPLLLDRDRAGDLGILVAASPRRYQRLGAATLVTLSALQRRAVVRAVADPCRDAPRLRYSVGAVAADRTTSVAHREVHCQGSGSGRIDRPDRHGSGRPMARTRHP